MANRRLSGYNSPYYGCFGGGEYEYAKFLERHRIRRAASGTGFFVFAYSVLMYALSYGLYYLLTYLFRGNSDFYETYTTAVYFLDIFVSAAAVFLPALVYIKASKQSFSGIISVKRVKANVLVPLVFLGMGAAVLANIATSIVAQNFSIFGIGNSLSSSGTADKNALEIMLNIISVVVVPAFAEEFAFRGVVMGSMRRFGDGAAILLSSVLFAAMHQNISQIPFAFILGLVFACIDCACNSIIPSIIVHFVNNLYANIMSILSEQGILDSQAYSIACCGMFMFFGIAGIVSYIILTKKNIAIFKVKNDRPAQCAAEPAAVLSAKEKYTAVFTNVGVLLCLVLFTISTVMNLGLIND